MCERLRMTLESLSLRARGGRRGELATTRRLFVLSPEMALLAALRLLHRAQVGLFNRFRGTHICWSLCGVV